MKRVYNQNKYESLSLQSRLPQSQISTSLQVARGLNRNVASALAAYHIKALKKKARLTIQSLEMRNKNADLLSFLRPVL